MYIHNYIETLTHIIQNWQIHIPTAVVTRLSLKYNLPLKVSGNNTRGFFVQVYTGPGAPKEWAHFSVCTYMYIHTCNQGVREEEAVVPQLSKWRGRSPSLLSFCASHMNACRCWQLKYMYIVGNTYIIHVLGRLCTYPCYVSVKFNS